MRSHRLLVDTNLAIQFAKCTCACKLNGHIINAVLIFLILSDTNLVSKCRKHLGEHIWRSTFGQVACSVVSSYRSGLPKVVMRERNGAGRQEGRRRGRRNGGRSAKARRRKRSVEEWRTFRYRSPPHNRTSVTEGAIPDHLVSLHRGRPGHLAVTSAVRPSLRFFPHCLPIPFIALYLSLSLPPSLFLLSQLLEPSESIKSCNSQRRSSRSYVFPLDIPKKDRERGGEGRIRDDHIFRIPGMSSTGLFRERARSVPLARTVRSVYGLRRV